MGESTSAAVDNPVTSRQFRAVLGQFCTGVTVVTGMGATGMGAIGIGAEAPMGFTCQAFSSLSLDPPRVVLCVSRDSVSWPSISAGAFFCVNVLAERQGALSDRFARSGGEKFRGVDWELSPDGAPRLAGACAWIDCRVHTEHDGGDHLVVIGEVRRLAVPADDRAPLLYHRGRYARLDAAP
ncbi:flavin reductase family protein [Streptomyces sp. LP11]|uniref:Flavin reductase family protein n=1 Tax=Streptomyces pyxinicus TaxID=2970331 RepID=A0ABT2B547_9ACTN|nr:flavin reductase family protein [Streptomyces sp. LP11]MCS0603621.1 flavin reductase family protein [Streptomyces sp. LP11]